MSQNSKQTLAGVDRVENGFVVVMVPASNNNDDNFKEMAIPAGRFKTLPQTGDVIPVDIDRQDVITLNVGTRLFCEVEFSIFGAASRSEIKQYAESCKLSGLYANPADAAAICQIRGNFWKLCSKDKEKLEDSNPNKSVFIAKSSWWTDKYDNRKVFSEFVRSLGSTSQQPGATAKVPNTF